MENWKEISPVEYRSAPFTMYDRDWALLTVEAGGKTNAMTISWGGVGTLWSRSVATVYVRESRFTFDLMEQAERFSVCFFSEEQHKALQYMGTASGRDEDKVAGSGLTLVAADGVPAFAEAHTVLVCRKLYGQMMTPESFVEKDILGTAYRDGDLHKIYFGGVEKIFVK